MAAESVIDVHDLRRRYGRAPGFEAVRGISFAVDRGELFALLGTNGAGKTSAMELVEGLDQPSSGTVRVFGRDPFAERSSIRPRMGVVLQEGGFLPDLTVAETARMWAATLSHPRPIVEALDLVQLEDRRNTRVGQLSGGERRRLDLALSLLGRPDVLFMDEPTTGLDPESRRNTWQLLRKLLLDGITILLTTHYLEEAQELADRVAIMHAGRIIRSGTVAEVVQAHPARITFSLDHPVPLPALAGTTVREKSHQEVILQTDTLQDTLTELLTWARSRNVALHGLDARSPSLEEAFLAMTDVGIRTDTEVAA